MRHIFRFITILMAFWLAGSLSSCIKETSFETETGTDSTDNSSAGIWVLKYYETKNFEDPLSRPSVSYFQYDTIQNTITLIDTLFSSFTTDPFIARTKRYRYNENGLLASFTYEIPARSEILSLTVDYNSDDLPENFSYVYSGGGTTTRVGVFEWSKLGDKFFGKYTDPGVTSTPYSTGDTRFLLDSAKRLEELTYITQDPANYGDAKESVTRNTAGEVLIEKYQQNFAGRFITLDSVYYERDYSKPDRLYSFYRLWAGGLHWYNTGYDVGFTQGLTRYTDLFDYDKHNRLRSVTYSESVPGSGILEKLFEQTVVNEYDSNDNPIKIVVTEDGVRKYEIKLTWQKISWN